MPNKTLTETAIKAAVPPTAGTITLWDGSLKNFGLRVSQGGAKTFIVLIGSGRRQAIGRHPLVTLSEARTQAKRILAEKTLGKVRPPHVAFDDARDEYLALCEKEHRPRTVEEYRRLLTRHYPYGRTSIASVSSRDVQRRLAKLADKPAERHSAYRADKTFFRWCVRQQLIDRSPLEHAEVPPPVSSRERMLSQDEAGAVFQTAISGGTAFHRIVALLLLTGQRRGEIARLEWSWINEEERTITLPSRITKNKRTHTFPYGSAVATVLDSAPRFDNNPFVFPAARDRIKGKPATTFNGWNKPKVAFDKELREGGFVVAPWRLHDLRRAVSSHLASLRVAETVVERLLNHVSGGTLSPIAQVYNRYSYLGEMRDAVQKWQEHLRTLQSKQESTNV